MINVLHIISDSNIGGAGMHLVSLAKAIDKSKFKLYIACPKDAQIIKLLENYAKIIEMPMAKDKSFDFKSIFKLKKIIKENNINIVHTHANLSGRIAAKLCGIKIIFTRHTPGKIQPINSFRWKINKFLNNFLCDKVIAVSNYIANQLRQFGINEEKIVTVYNGVDCSYFCGEFKSDEIKKIYNLDNEIILLQIARLEEIKGHKYLLEAVSGLLKKDYNIKLIIVGTGSLESEIHELSQDLNISDKIIFTGEIKDIRSILSISDIVVLPSLMEALGLVLIEGMCMSKPCIASNVDGIPEVIIDNVNGILVEPKNVTALQSALEKLINNSELRINMGIEGKKIANEKFNVNVMIQNIQKIYTEILS